MIKRRIFWTMMLAALAVGCASSEKQLERAQKYETEGRYLEAAEYYIKVLEDEPDWLAAREGLRSAGPKALADLFAEAQAAEARSDFDDARRALDRLDDLRRRAAGVEVSLPAPEGYAGYRDRLTERAIAFHLDAAADAEAQGDWSMAVRAYERAATYAEDPATQDRIASRQAHALLGWAEADADAGRYRAAFDRAGAALALVGPEHRLAETVAGLQEAALEAGTHYVAYLPLWHTDEVGRTASDAFLRDLDDLLLYERWSAPPPFLATADPVAVRRELRRLGYDRAILSREQASDVGRFAEADFVVAGEVTRFDREERTTREKTRTSKLRGRPSSADGPKEASWIEQRFRLTLVAEADYRIIDPRTRRVVDAGSVRESVSGEAQRGVYAGDYRDLDLSGSELSLFEDDEAEAVQDLENQLADALAARLADRIHARLLTQVP